MTITALLRALALICVEQGTISPEAAASIFRAADDADGGITGMDARRARLSPLQYCRICGEWVERPCLAEEPRAPETV